MRAIAPGFGLGGLDEAVEAFENAVGDLAFEPSEHAVPVIHDGVGDLDHWRHSAVLGVFHPCLEQGGALVAILDREDALKGQPKLVGLRRFEVLVFE